MNTREEWLASRRKGIGGSDAAAVCGMSPWKTPLDVYLDKIGALDDVENPAMRRGTLLEPVVRQMYADEAGLAVEIVPNIVSSDKYPFALANLDGKAKSGDVPLIVECKTARNRSGWGEPWSDEIPVAYLFQVQHYMAVTGFPLAHVAVLFGTDFDFAVYEVSADGEFQELMMQQEAEFWRMVETRTPPDLSNIADVSKRWPISRPISRPATKDDLNVAAQLLAVKEYYKKLDAYRESLEAEVKRSMEDVEALVCGEEVIVTWKTAKPATRFDAKRFQADHPELYQKYLSQSAASRRFLLKGETKCLQIMKPLLNETLLSSNREMLGS